MNFEVSQSNLFHNWWDDNVSILLQKKKLITIGVKEKIKVEDYFTKHWFAIPGHLRLEKAKSVRTCSKINNDIYKEYGVRETVEGNPARAEVVVEEGDSNWQDDEIRHQEKEHA